MPSLARTFGGPVEALIGYASASVSTGDSVTIIAPRCAPADLAALEQALPSADIRTVGPRRGPAWAAVPAIGQAVRGVAKTATVVHVHGLFHPASTVATRMAVGCDVPVVIDPFGTLSPYTFSHRSVALKRAYFRAFDGPHVRRANGVHFATDRERDEARSLGIDLRGRAHVVPPPVPRMAGGISAGRSSADVLFLSRLDPKKGLEILLSAWPAVRRRVPDARLIIAGTGRQRYELALQSFGASLGPSVEWRGFLTGDAKAQCLADAAVAVLPSAHENFGIAILDAVAAGVPVVATPAVGLASVITEEKWGVVTDRSPGAVADAIVDVLANDAMRRHVQRTGPAAVARRFGVAAIAPALSAMYAAAMAHAAGATPMAAA